MANFTGFRGGQSVQALGRWLAQAVRRPRSLDWWLSGHDGGEAGWQCEAGSEASLGGWEWAQHRLTAWLILLLEPNSWKCKHCPIPAQLLALLISPEIIPCKGATTSHLSYGWTAWEGGPSAHWLPLPQFILRNAPNSHLAPVSRFCLLPKVPLLRCYYLGEGLICVREKSQGETVV